VIDVRVSIVLCPLLFIHLHRIRQANNAAAAFYTKCLVTLPTAGKARAHLRSRKLSPDSIRTFALGYAPDFYYGDESTSESTEAAKKTWGEGSLVEYLSNMGFTPNEIVESGLAVRTKSKSANKPPSMEDESLDCSDLMDRFRNRLVVPILDKKGKDVIGFGGRHLESMGTTDSSYTPAKYINSPESAIFKKKVQYANFCVTEALMHTSY
jgi:DNA primase